MTGTVTDRESASRPLRMTPAPFLFLGLECARPLAGSSRHALFDVDSVEVGRGAARVASRRATSAGVVLDLHVPDGHMSGQHARLTRTGTQWLVEDLGSKNGTFVNGVRVSRRELRDGETLQLGHTMFLFRAALPAYPQGLSDVDIAAPADAHLSTLVPSLDSAFGAFKRAARSTMAIVVLGESGTGKELAARAAHRLSARRDGAFVAINCGAIAPTLLESELFGYKKGAFSGAVKDHVGLVRSADGGTLFLDEVGELSAAGQASLLRVVQEGEVLPVGATRPIGVDLRIVAATHRDLDAMALSDAFRHDLLARLSGFTLELPRLRERREDLGLILATMLRARVNGGGASVTITPQAALALYSYDWPLNIRELEKCVDHALAMNSSGAIGVDDLPEAIRSPPDIARVGVPRAEGPDVALREELVRALVNNQGNISAVAREMGRARVQIQRYLRRFKIDAKRYSTE